MEITHQTVLGEDGQPAAVLIPWDVFIEIQGLLEGDEPTAEELAAIREAEEDRRQGNADAFTKLEDLEAELLH